MKRCSLVLALPALALFLACAGGPPLRPADPDRLQHRHAPGDLRVMTFNIHSGLAGLDRVAEVIQSAHPDFVALQEVDRGTDRTGGQDQVALLSEKTGMPHRAYFKTTSLSGGDYGVAVLSRFPIVQAKKYALPTPFGLEPRTVAHAVVDVDGQEVSFYVTHLTNLPRRSAVRARQARAIAALLSIDPRPRVVMGDMNDAPDSPAVLTLLRQTRDVFALRGQGPADTFPLPSILPDQRLDYVLACEKLVARRAFVLRKLASDHYPVVADLTLKGAPDRARLADAAAAEETQAPPEGPGGPARVR